MTEVNKKYNTDDVVWYYPFPGERVPLRIILYTLQKKDTLIEERK
jgi:hypothetical protein